jgi:DNA mismatch repair protein MutS
MERDDFLWMDRFTIRNLELLQTGIDNGNCLLKVLDNTVSPMGARLLKRWLVFPLKDVGRINERLQAVEQLILHADTRKQLAHAIKVCGDIERLVSKIPMKKINPRETMQLAKGLQQTEIIKQVCAACNDPYLQRLGDALNGCHLIVEKILQEINETPPGGSDQRRGDQGAGTPGT